MTDRTILVMGGAHVDRRGRIAGETAPGASNPGAWFVEAGGGAFNAARNLSRLGHRVRLVSPRGGDSDGDIVAAATTLRRRGLLALIVATIEDVTEQTRRAVLRQRGAGGERNRQRNERREAETVKIARHVTLRMPAYGRCRPGDR